MVLKLKLVPIGDSVGAAFSKEVLAKLKVGQGDTVFLTETADGFRLTPYDPAFEAQMTSARAIMKKRRNALRDLSR